MQTAQSKLPGIAQGMEPEFEEFWKAYPKKRKKGDAFKAWRQTATTRPLLAEVLKAINLQKNSVEWKKDAGQYIPLPGSWLRGWGWGDAVYVDTDMAQCAKCRRPLNGGYTATDDGRVCPGCWGAYVSGR